MQEILRNTAPNLLVLCVDKINKNDLLGRLYTRYSTEAVPFKSLMEVICSLDAFFDEIKFPQKTLKLRSFDEPKLEKEPSKRKLVQKVSDMMKHRGDLATFVVHIQYRQNATWQGKVVWTEKKKEIPFRSALELIKLIDEAVTIQAENTSETEESEDEI